MNKRPRKLGRFFSLFLAFLMVTSVVFGMHLTVKAAEITKTEKIYDIAVVFDNSGSMYDNQAWCRAKYAMEIFASMLNYERDKLHIFPMWEITTDGSQPDSGGSYAAIEVKSKEDIDKISNIYTVHPSNTPFAPISEAYDYLNSSSADEKWLIVLTDGEFNQDSRGKNASIDLQTRLSTLASKSIKVQYLGFGEASKLNANEANFFFAKKSSDTSLKDDLIGICNSIFQRSVLPSNRLSGNSLKLDLSMKNLIVFVQGANAKIDSLKDSNGKTIKEALNSGQRKYSKIAARKYNNAPVDTSLAGQVVTFAACPKGEYTLSYSGTDSVQIFYEPDVDIDVSLVNNDGEQITGKDDFVAGEYTVTSKIVDGKTREDVTSHELMGKDVKLKTRIKASKDDKYKDYDNGSKIRFEPDEKTTVCIEGTYLGKYKISSKDDPDLAWLSNINVQPPFAELAIKASVLQQDSWYIIKDHNKWKPVRVDMTLDGRPLTDEELSRTNLRVDASNGLKVRYEPLPGESAYNIYISQNEKGEYIKPETGSYKINVAATYTNEFEKKTVSNSDDVQFKIQKYSLLVRRLIIIGTILLILLILTAITIFLHKIKVFPNGIDTENSSYTKGGKGVGVAAASLSVANKSLFKKTGNISVRSTKGSMAVSLTIEAVHPLFRWLYNYQKPSRRRYKITGISASGMDYVTVNGTSYKKDTYSEINEICSDQTSVEFSKMSGGVRHIVKADLMNK